MFSLVSVILSKGDPYSMMHWKLSHDTMGRVIFEPTHPAPHAVNSTRSGGTGKQGRCASCWKAVLFYIDLLKCTRLSYILFN